MLLIEGLIWSPNFGPVVQVKHLPLSYNLVVEVCLLTDERSVSVINSDNVEARHQLELNPPNNLVGIIPLRDWTTCIPRF